jgi:hypothetical protein
MIGGETLNFEDCDDGNGLIYTKEEGNHTFVYYLRSRPFFETEPFVDRRDTEIVGHFLTSNRTKVELSLDNETEFINSFQYVTDGRIPRESCSYAFVPFAMINGLSGMWHRPYQMPTAFDFHVQWDGPFSKGCCENVGHVNDRPSSRVAF